MLHVTPRTPDGQRTKMAKEVCGAVPGASITHTNNNNATGRRKTSMLYATQR